MRLIPRLPKRVALPVELAQTLGFDQPRAGDKIMAWSLLMGGGAAVATVTDLRILTPRGATMIRAWEQIDHAVWDQDSRTLVIWWVDSRRTTPLEIQDDIGRLPEVVRERVQASVVLIAHVPLPYGKPARVALRKTADGSLIAQSLLPSGVQADDPQVAPLIEAAVNGLWSEAGDRGLNAQTLPDLRAGLE